MNHSLARCRCLSVWGAVAILLLGRPVCATDREGVAETPPILQVLALPDGRMAALTPERGGLYLSEPGGVRWRRADPVPNLFLHHLALGPAGTLYLSTTDGLFAKQDSDPDWQQIMEGSLAWSAFAHPTPAGRGGATAAIKRWGQDLIRVAGPQSSRQAQGLPSMPAHTVAVSSAGSRTGWNGCLSIPFLQGQTSKRLRLGWRAR